MKITIKVKNIIFYGIALIVLTDLCFFYLFDIPNVLTSFIGKEQKNMLVILTVVLFLLCVQKNGYGGERYSSKFIKYYIACAVCAVFVLGTYSALIYTRQDMFAGFRLSAYLLVILLAYPLFWIFNKYNGYTRILNIINYIYFIWYVVAIIQAILYAKNGTVICNYMFSRNYYGLRYDKLRISLNVLGNFLILYNFHSVIQCEKKIRKKIFNIIQIILGIYCLFNIQMTRIYQISILISMIVILIFNERKLGKRLLLLLIVGIGAGAIETTGVMATFFSSFDLNGDLGGSTLERFNAYHYYFEKILSNPIMGFGFPHPDYYATVEHGVRNAYYISDTGIVGSAAQLGIFVIPLYIGLLIRMIYICYKINKAGKYEVNSLLLGILTFMLICIATLSILMPATIIFVPFVLAIFEYSYKMICAGKI